MNKLTIIGNLTKDPELRTTQSGISVCSFTVAVNRRRKPDQQQETDYFRVTTWRERAELCGKWLVKGKKVAVTGPVSVSTYTGQDGKMYANLEVTADDIEFLTPAGNTEPQGKVDSASGFTAVETDELPF